MTEAEQTLGFVAATLSLGDIVARLGLATLLGMFIGIEREARQKAAGLRTHMLVSLTAAAFTVLAFEMFHQATAVTPGVVDPVRAVEAVVTGVAFLGAGAIIRGRGNVHGITTGAGIWLAGAIGMACGAGFYVIAAVCVVFALIVLAAIGWLEIRLGVKKSDQG